MVADSNSSGVNYDHIFKIIVLGDNGVGKSSFIRRFCEGTFVADMESTIGVDFYLSEIECNGKKIKVGVSRGGGVRGEGEGVRGEGE